MNSRELYTLEDIYTKICDYEEEIDRLLELEKEMLENGELNYNQKEGLIYFLSKEKNIRKDRLKLHESCQAVCSRDQIEIVTNGFRYFLKKHNFYEIMWRNMDE